MTSPGSRRIRLLIVDDSTFVRRVLRRIFRGTEDIVVVGEARTGEEALRKVQELDPDVVALDLQLPQLNGIEVLRALQRISTARVIMVSSFTGEGTEEALLALEEGAIDVVDKSKVRNRLDFLALSEELIAKVRAAAEAAPQVQPLGIERADTGVAVGASRPTALVLVGASTGGPPALRRFLAALTPTFPGAIVIVQHMPPSFTTGYARRLDQASPILVEEAREGTALASGTAYVVPSSAAVRFERRGDRWCLHLTQPSSAYRHRPSFNATLEAALEVDMPRYAVVLTGMGDDGAAAIAAFKAAGGRVLVQDRGSSTIYGMPRAVKEQVEVDHEGPPEALAQWLRDRLMRLRRPEER